MELYIDNGRSILLFFFRSCLTFFATFMHKSRRKVTQTKIKASFICLKYNKTAEKTRQANMTSSHITKTTTEKLEQKKGGIWSDTLKR
ncbi:hypothetical protein RHGRI_022165 [Rhododendron griersonianum]|uniref:Ribosomal protein L33 n=1 Tax=Rhododendron griersonianum TaxID=479676 RepID=A0AAV6JP92_9ERIC|nr:hypothetical protein RHGRI_022165 [Rhododendron griersonianum]